jgi:hypothetical protein
MFNVLPQIICLLHSCVHTKYHEEKYLMAAQQSRLPNREMLFDICLNIPNNYTNYKSIFLIK